MSGREEWMLGEDLPFDFDKQDEIKKEIPKKKSIVSERELNPYYRKGSESAVTRKSTTQSIEWTSVLVKRAIKMIESGEKTFENAAIDRFGSVEAFEDAIRQVERHERIKLNIRIPKSTTKEAKSNETTNTRTTENSVSNTNTVSNANPLSQDDVNKLMAKKMKAELAGDFETSRRLEEEIKKYHEKPKEKLTLLPSETYNKRKAEKDMTIAEMVRHEKLTSFKEFDRELERGISGNKRFKDDLDTLDEQVNIDHELNSGKSNTFDCRARSIDEFRNRERITKECSFCPDSGRFKQERASDWIVARGHYTYLCIPKTRSIHPFHCLIVPTSHSCSLLDCHEFEEEIWEEVRNFKKCLLQLAAKQDRSFVFMECVMNVGDARRHTFIDCIPTPRGQYAEHVKGHFLKALQESESEWSQNKKVIDTSTKAGGLRYALPRKHFSYFYVDFRLDQGYAHVIEDPEKFEGGGDFGRDIMASVLGVPRNEWRVSRTSVDEFKRFSVLFQPFDWTKSIE